MTPWYTLILTVMLNVQPYAMFNTIDGEPVYFRTEQLKVGVGHYATVAACDAERNLALAGAATFDPFTLGFTPQSGITVYFPFTNALGAPLTPGTYQVGICVKVSVPGQ